MPVGRTMTSSTPSRFAATAEPLAEEFRLLIDIAGRERCVFVSRRVLDVTMDADRAAVHDAPDADLVGHSSRFTTASALATSVSHRR